MKICKFRMGLMLLVLAAFGPSSARATLIVAGTTSLQSKAIQDVTLFANTSLNQSSSDITINGLFGVGVLTLNRDAQVGSTINISSFSGGMYRGSIAGLGDYVFGNIAPLTGADFSGEITNVVQDATDPGFDAGLPSSFMSGDFSFGGNSFGFEFLTGPLAGVKLFTSPATPFGFAATFDGLPPTDGTTLLSTGFDVLDVYFGTELVGSSSNRTIIISTAYAPEPSTLAMLASGAVGLVGYRLRRRRATTA